MGGNKAYLGRRLFIDQQHLEDTREEETGSFRVEMNGFQVAGHGIQPQETLGRFLWSGWVGGWVGGCFPS